MGRHKLSDERLLDTEAPLDLFTYMQFIYTYIRLIFAFPLLLSEYTVRGLYFYEQAQACCGLSAYAAVSSRLTPISFRILIYEQVSSWSSQEISCEFVLEVSGV